MVTNIDNKTKYLKLWEKFENLLEDKSWTLYEFSTEYAKNKSDEEYDNPKFYNRLKKMKERIHKSESKPQKKTIEELEAFINSLYEDYVVEEMREDEWYEHWFD